MQAFRKEGERNYFCVASNVVRNNWTWFECGKKGRIPHNHKAQIIIKTSKLGVVCTHCMKGRARWMNHFRSFLFRFYQLFRHPANEGFFTLIVEIYVAVCCLSLVKSVNCALLAVLSQRSWSHWLKRISARPLRSIKRACAPMAHRYYGRLCYVCQGCRELK